MKREIFLPILNWKHWVEQMQTHKTRDYARKSLSHGTHFAGFIQTQYSEFSKIKTASFLNSVVETNQQIFTETQKVIQQKALY